MDQLKGKENLIKSPKYVIHLFGDVCYAASSNLQNILHVLKISGCMMRSAVTNGLICCICAAWRLYCVSNEVRFYMWS